MNSEQITEALNYSDEDVFGSDEDNNISFDDTDDDPDWQENPSHSVINLI